MGAPAEREANRPTPGEKKGKGGGEGKKLKKKNKFAGLAVVFSIRQNGGLGKKEKNL